MTQLFMTINIALYAICSVLAFTKGEHGAGVGWFAAAFWATVATAVYFDSKEKGKS